jgi:acyl carrier protein
MERQIILEKINDIMREFFDDDDLVIVPETTADDVKGWNSLNHINILIAIEEKFGIKIKTSEVDGLHDVGALIELIHAKLSST